MSREHMVQQNELRSEYGLKIMVRMRKIEARLKTSEGFGSGLWSSALTTSTITNTLNNEN